MQLMAVLRDHDCSCYLLTLQKCKYQNNEHLLARKTKIALPNLANFTSEVFSIMNFLSLTYSFLILAQSTRLKFAP